MYNIQDVEQGMIILENLTKKNNPCFLLDKLKVGQQVMCLLQWVYGSIFYYQFVCLFVVYKSAF